MVNYPQPVTNILNQAPEMSLEKGEPNTELSTLLESTPPMDLFPAGATENQDMARCCQAALYLLNNQLDPAHRICQDMEIPEAAFWHGILHRREGDFGNAKYWFAKVGPHPVIHQLQQEFGKGYGSPDQFVDSCQCGIEDDPELKKRCLTIQKAEWNLLFDFCYSAALHSRH